MKSSIECGIKLGLLRERLWNKRTVISLGGKMVACEEGTLREEHAIILFSLSSSTYNKCYNMLNVWSCVFNKFNKQISSDIPNTSTIRISFKLNVCLE